jgi:hypothetical protein
MDKFIREKRRREDTVRKRGADPVWMGIRKNDEYIDGVATISLFSSKKQAQAEALFDNINTRDVKISKSPKEHYVSTIINSSNSFPEEFMAVKENKELVSRLRAAKRAKIAATAELFGEQAVLSLSEGSRNDFVRLMLVHPDTRIRAITQVSEYEKEVEISGFNEGFVRELVRALKAYDNQKKSAPTKETCG